MGWHEAGEGVQVASQISDLAACLLYYNTDDPEELSSLGGLPVCLPGALSSSSEDTSHIGLGPTPMTSS